MNPILSAVKRKLEKQFNKKMISEGPPQEEVIGVSSGSLLLDLACGAKGGAFPLGRITEIYGDSSNGKTTLALSGMSNWYKSRKELGHEDRSPAYVDMERTTTQKAITSFGIPIKEVIWATPDSAEEAFQTVYDLVASGNIGYIVLDSVDACVSQRQIDKNIGDNDVGGNTKQLNNLVRQLTKIAFETNTIIIFINQVRLNPNAGSHSNPNTTPGGKAVGFYSTLRLEMMNKGKTTTPNAFQMRIRIRKNKMTPPIEDTIEFDCLYMKGPDPISDIVETTKTMGLAKFAGPTFKVMKDGAFVNLCTGGKPGLKAFLEEHPEELETLKQLCVERASENFVRLPEETEEEKEEEIE